MMDPHHAKVRFGIIGGAGRRARFFLRVAWSLPEQFEVVGSVVRDEAKAVEHRERWGVPTYPSVDAMLDAVDMAFVVVSVKRNSAPPVLHQLADRDVPALCETPPSDELERLVELHERTRHGARIQVAEQYPYQPMHAARLALVDGGRLGRVSQAQVSAAHGYHGMALLRRLLHIGYEDVTIRASRFTSPIVAKPRNAAPQNVDDAETIRESRQTLAHLDFGDRLGVYDFTGDQYTSWIRGPRVLVRGDRGEIINDDVRFLTDARTPVEFALRRIDAGHDGNLEGYHHKGVVGGETWLYRNAFVPGRLSDEELAVATCLAQMGRYAAGGNAFYPVAEAAQDVYLAQLIEQAVETGEAMCSDRQPWAQ